MYWPTTQLRHETMKKKQCLLLRWGVSHLHNFMQMYSYLEWELMRSGLSNAPVLVTWLNFWKKILHTSWLLCRYTRNVQEAHEIRKNRSAGPTILFQIHFLFNWMSRYASFSFYRNYRKLSQWLILHMTVAEMLPFEESLVLNYYDFGRRWQWFCVQRIYVY